MLEVIDLDVAGAKLVTPKKHQDDRGFFSEVYNKRELAQAGITDDFVQDNHSLSHDIGVVRGLHFQIEPHPAAKLVRIAAGAVLDVVVDLRHGSPTFGRHVAVELTADNWSQVYVPTGCAHGFCTLKPNTEVMYKVTNHWEPSVDKGVAWDDPELGIDWPVAPGDAILSDKDRMQPRLSELDRYFEWGP